MSRLPENPIIDQAHPAGPLFDGPGPGAPPPVADADLACVLDEIHQCSGYANQVRAFMLMSWLMRGRTSVPARACPVLIKVFRNAVADLPMPLVDDTVVNHRFILDRLLEHSAVQDDSRLLSDARTAAYRLCEAINDFDRAKAILGEMIASIDEQEDPVRGARLINNYAFEFLLEGDYRAALPHFQEAVERFRTLNLEHEIANAEANVLTCEFALSPFDTWENLLPRLLESHRVLAARGDWHMRKTMRLLAIRAEARGRLSLAIAWARRALRVSRGLPTRLHREDRVYYDSLRGRWQQGNLFDHAWPCRAPRANRAGTQSP